MTDRRLMSVVIYNIHKESTSNEIEIQATEEFENKKLHAVELTRLTHLLKVVIDSMDSITKNPNVSLAIG